MDFLINITIIIKKFFFGISGVIITAIILNDFYNLIISNSGLMANSVYFSNYGLVQNVTISIVALLMGIGFIIRAIGFNNVIDLFKKNKIK